jgi:hypothetical protein
VQGVNWCEFEGRDNKNGIGGCLKPQNGEIRLKRGRAISALRE